MPWKTLKLMMRVFMSQRICHDAHTGDVCRVELQILEHILQILHKDVINTYSTDADEAKQRLNQRIPVYIHGGGRRGGGRRGPAVACWASDHWVASSNPLRGKFRH